MAKSVYSLLRKKFPENAYALMAEVSNSTGYGRSRSADYMVMSLWPSRGLHLHGIELKSSRGDWLRELKNPNKQELIFKHCDLFWLLTDGDNIAKLEEIPETWGWMSIKGNKIFIKKAAPKLDPEPITRGFLGAMLRRAQSKEGFIHRESIQDKLNEAKEAGIHKTSYEKNRIQKSYDELLKVMEDFRKESGVSLPTRDWGDNVRNIGSAVHFLKNGGADSIEKRLLNLEESAKNILMSISTGLELIKSKDNG